MEYAELHCHSSFSMLDGASNPEELVLRAKDIGLAALALTDHDDMGGTVRFSQASRECGLPAITGAEITMEDGSHLTLLVENTSGYSNLCRLITESRSACPRGQPRLAYESLFASSSGLIAMSGCPHGAIPSFIAAGKMEEAARLAALFREPFAGRFFLELWDHQLNQEALICQGLIQLSRDLSLPWLVTNNVHYSVPSKRIVHDVLTCLRHDVTLAEAGRRLRPNGNWYMRSPEEMHRLWSHSPEGLRNTLIVAERCAFRLGALKPSLPEFRRRSCETGTPAHPAAKDAADADFLRQLVWEGAAERYRNLSPKHIDQINHELAMIEKLGLAPYFLIMWDIVRFARSKGIAVQGRGSAANSAVCYCLAITAVDPVGMDLLFERFLSEGRNEPPDIDLDIAHKEREEVIQYVYDKYGREHAAMVCEAITYRGRSAVRDAARVLGFSAEQRDRLASETRFHEALEAARWLSSGGAAQAGLDIKDRRVQLLIKVVAGLDRLPRHRSIHVGGFVLSGRPIGEMVPVEPAAMPGRTVIQWDKDDLDPVGMIKIDLLGLGMLTMIQEALKLIEKHRGLNVDLAALDMDDTAVYEMLRQADTIGVFQVESRAQMSILPKLRPERFYDIVVSIALIRPGPIQGNIVHPYIRRRRGQEPVTYLHPSLAPILERTLGVPLFQEQGMRLAVTAAGFTPAQADHLRRVMSHKRSKEKMAELCQRLAIGMRERGLDEEAIGTITHQLQAFANYGFPESHAASFALLVYASAYIKRYFAPEFYCAMLNAQPMGFYSPATLIRDAIRHAVEVRQVDMGASQWHCTLEPAGSKPALRIGLRYVQGLGAKARESLENAWSHGGAFISIEDAVRRSGLGQGELAVLCKAGAFESFIADRRQALWHVLALVRRQHDLPLFRDGIHGAAGASPAAIPAMTALERTTADYEAVGLSAAEHPMVFYRQWAEASGMRSCAEIAGLSNGQTITVAGGVICRQRPETAKGFVFMTMEDETGMANAIIRPQIFAACRKTILSSPFLAVTGRLQIDDGVTNLLADKIEALPALPAGPRLPARDFH